MFWFYARMIGYFLARVYLMSYFFPLPSSNPPWNKFSPSIALTFCNLSYLWVKSNLSVSVSNLSYLDYFSLISNLSYKKLVLYSDWTIGSEICKKFHSKSVYGILYKSFFCEIEHKWLFHIRICQKWVWYCPKSMYLKSWISVR